jgi:hypothetical protein
MQLDKPRTRHSPGQVPLVKAPALVIDGRDLVLENDLVHLLARLEFFRVTLEGQLAHGRPSLALETATALVNHLAGFAEQRLDPEPHAAGLAVVLAKVGDFITSVQRLRELPGGSALKTWFGVREAAAPAAERRQLLRRIARGAGEITEDFCSLFTASFHASDAARLWRDTADAFLTDLKRVLDKLER